MRRCINYIEKKLCGISVSAMPLLQIRLLNCTIIKKYQLLTVSSFDYWVDLNKSL